MPAGKLKHRVRLEKRTQADDGFGTIVAGDWTPQGTVWAQLTPRLGSESVMAERLQGRQPYTVRVRASSLTRQVDASWRAVNVRTGEVMSIISPLADVGQDGAYLDFLAMSGMGGQ